jgi:hypothetical protein
MEKDRGKVMIKPALAVLVFLVTAGCAIEGEDFRDDGGAKIVIDLPSAGKKDKPTLYPILDTKAGKYGFKNAENRWVITPEYDNSGLIRLRDGYYLVRKTGKDGKSEYVFLDKYGENAIGRTFENAWEFASGIALVSENGRTAIINRAGVVVDKVSEQDDPALNKNLLLDGRLFIASGKENIEDERGKTRVRDVWTGKTLYEGTYHYAMNVEGRYAVVDDVMKKTTYLYGYNGKVQAIKGYYVLRPGVEEIIMGPYERKDPYAGDLYVYDLKKEEISPFPEWKDYGDKAVLEKVLEFESAKRLYIYMVNSDTNNLLIYNEPMTMKNHEAASGTVLGEFSEGIAPLQTDIKGRIYCFIKTDGKYAFASAINGHFQQAYEFVDGYALVQLGARREGRYYNDKWCYVDKKGHIKIREDVGYIQKESGQWFLE